MKRCLKCNQELFDHSIICRFCGNLVVNDKNESANNAVIDNRTQTCSYCNKTNSFDSIICRYCGNFLKYKLEKNTPNTDLYSENTDSMSCPYCYETILAKSTICCFCGKTILQASQNQVVNADQSRYSSTEPFERTREKSKKPKALIAFWSSLVLSGIAYSTSVAGAKQIGINAILNNGFFTFISSIALYWILGMIILAIKPNLKVWSVVGILFALNIAIFFVVQILGSL